MPNKAEERKIEYSDTKQVKWINGYGSYQYCIPTQDQIIACFKGMRISGTYKKTGDSQSEDIDATTLRSRSEAYSVFLDIVNQYIKELDRPWEVWKNFFSEEPARSVAVEEQVGDRAVDTATDDVLQLTSDQIASAILDPEAEADMPHLREMILIAEDTGFTVEQSKQLAPWLLSFAERHRDSSDPQDEAAVWSAIRTGASMLTPDSANDLHKLLEPGHSIETSLVTLKMIGRIFEAQPPKDVDQHKELANEICQIANSLLNRYAISVSQSAAMAQLAIYALAAMASSETQQIVETVQQLGVTWFTQQTLRELCELRSIWSNRPVPVEARPQELLERVIQILE